MKKGLFWLFVITMGVALTGCACGKKVEEPPPPPPPVVKPAPPPPPVQPAPPPRKDRN